MAWVPFQDNAERKVAAQDAWRRLQVASGRPGDSHTPWPSPGTSACASPGLALRGRPRWVCQGATGRSAGVGRASMATLPFTASAIPPARGLSACHAANAPVLSLPASAPPIAARPAARGAGATLSEARSLWRASSVRFLGIPSLRSCSAKHLPVCSSGARRPYTGCCMRWLSPSRPPAESGGCGEP